jgi:AcrR family transcriptional regulator
MSARRDELLERSIDYLLAHGVANLSLRQLAQALGTSARMLIYHFGSRDGLIIAAMSEVRARFQTEHDRAFAARSSSARHPLLKFWASMTSPGNLRYVRLLLEVQILALQNPSAYACYLDLESTSWLDAVERVLAPKHRSRETALLCMAVVDGLLLSVLNSGDRRRATDALALFLAQLHGKRWPATRWGRGGGRR